MNSAYNKAMCRIEEYRRLYGTNYGCCCAGSSTGGSATVVVGQTITGAPGSLANVTNSGTPTNAILNFTIPRGATGPTHTVKSVIK